MTPNGSTVAVPVSSDGYPAVAAAPDSGFDARWEAWRARGIAHERAVRRKLIVVVPVGCAVAAAMAIGYALLRP